MKKLYPVIIYLSCLFISFTVKGQLYWRTDGSNFLLTNPVWGTNAAGPFTNAWVNNSNIFITGASGNAITNVSNTPVGNITITGNSNTNWGNAGTFSTGGNICSIDIGSGSVLTWNNQPVSTAAGTGFIKNGAGSWNIGSQPNLFTAGFTLNNGTILVNGDNALGGGIFYINGGTIQSASTRDMAVSSIVVGGDFEHAGTGNATWSMNMSLGSATRSILNTTLSGSRRYIGVVSGGAGAGMTFTGTGLAQLYFGNTANSFNGPISMNGAEAVFNDNGTLGTGSIINIDGGRLSFGVIDALGNTSSVSGVSISAGKTIYLGNTAGTSISILGTGGSVTINGIITDKAASTGSWAKQGGGRLSIAGACTYTGDTYINNGILQLLAGNNRLPVNGVVYIGQASNANLGTFDLNGFSQQVGGLYSVSGLNVTTSTNIITSATAATLTVSGKGKYGQGTTTNSGLITGAISLVKTGIDTLELADANTYTGTTTVSGGVLRINRTGGGTILSTSAITVNGGTFRVSSNQTVSNLAVSSGALLVDVGVTLTITGSYSGGGTITNNGTIVINASNNFPGASSMVTAGFNNLTIGAAVALDQSLTVNGTLTLGGSFSVGVYTLTLNGPAIAGTPTNLITTSSSSLVFGGIFSSVFIPTSVTQLANLSVGNSSGVSLNSILSVYSSVTLSSGTLAITAGNKLECNGASLAASGGYVSGTSTSDLAVIGTTGGTLNLPTSVNISLRNITVSGNRILKMDGVHHISLSGALTIASGSTYDNGGETQLINNGGSISITGTFITRDIQGFFATSAAIPGIVPVLNAGCTIEYALTGNQAVQGSTVSYKNVRFSGSGIKTLASTTSPNGTVFITGSAIVNTNNFNFGGALTALTMDGGRLIVTTAGTQPAMQGAYNLTAGVVEFKGASGQTVRTQTYQNIEITGAGVGNSSGNITLRNSGTFTVNSTGVFTINDNCIIGITPITNTQIVTVQSGGLFKSGNNQGFNGFTATLTDNSSVHSNITNIVLAPGSTVEYSRNGDQPITIANGLIYHHLTLSGTSGIKTAPAGNLTINGNITKTGIAGFAHNNGTVIINGTGIQTYTSSTPVMQFYNIDLNNAAGFYTASNMSIVKQLSFEDNSKLNLQSGYITLKSDAGNTANVGIIPVSASISYQLNTGFIVERYIATGLLTGQHTKGWQFLSVPVNGGQTVNNGWQEAAATPNANPNPGYGTQITSNIAAATTLGFDVFSPGGASMKTFNPATNAWDGIPNTTSYPLYTPKGYMLFVRGDRSVINFSGANSIPLPTTLRATGKIFAPLSNPPSSTTVLPGKFESVGNPYASAMDLTVFADYRTGDVQDIYYVWDPQLTTGPNSAYGYGGYRTLSRNGAVYDVTPAGGSYGSTTKNIQSGQAFFVSSFATGGTVNFDENCKVSGNTLVTKPMMMTGSSLKTNLQVMSNNEFILIDGVMNKFDRLFNDSLDMNDAFKFAQQGENLSIYTSATKLSVESRGLIRTYDTIHLRTEQLKLRTYRFELIPVNMAQPATKAFIYDRYLNTLTNISLTDTSYIQFNADPANVPSVDAQRFCIVFRKKINPPFSNNQQARQVDIHEKETAAVIHVLTNPATGNKIRLQFINTAMGKYQFSLVSNEGKLIYTELCDINPNTTKQVNIPQVPAAVYQLLITGPGRFKETKLIVIE